MNHMPTQNTIKNSGSVSSELFPNKMKIRIILVPLFLEFSVTLNLSLPSWTSIFHAERIRGFWLIFQVCDILIIVYIFFDAAFFCVLRIFCWLTGCFWVKVLGVMTALYVGLDGVGLVFFMVSRTVLCIGPLMHTGKITQRCISYCLPGL